MLQMASYCPCRVLSCCGCRIWKPICSLAASLTAVCRAASPGLAGSLTAASQWSHCTQRLIAASSMHKGIDFRDSRKTDNVCQFPFNLVLCFSHFTSNQWVLSTGLSSVSGWVRHGTEYLWFLPGRCYIFRFVKTRVKWKKSAASRVCGPGLVSSSLTSHQPLGPGLLQGRIVYYLS